MVPQASALSQHPLWFFASPLKPGVDGVKVELDGPHAFRNLGFCSATNRQTGVTGTVIVKLEVAALPRP